MESYEVLQKAIPELQAGKVAKFLSISADYVRRWRRRPADDEDPTATGQRSILDRVTDLIDVVFLINPRDTGLIVQYIVGHYRDLLKAHALPLDCQISVAETVEDLLVQTTEAVNKLNKEGCTEATHRELVQMRDAATLAIERVEATMYKESNDA